MKKVTVILVLALAVASVACAQRIPKAEAGGGLYFDVLPATIDGRVMVPLRSVFEWLGAKVEFRSGEIYAFQANSIVPRVVLRIGDINALLSNQPYQLDVPPVLLGGRTFVPLRFVAESFGVWVEAKGRHVTLQMPQYELTAEMAVPPAEGSHLAKIWMQIARYYDLGGVAPMPGDLPHWNLYSVQRQGQLRVELGSDAAGIVEAHWRGRELHGIRVVGNELDLTDGIATVDVMVKWADGEVERESFGMVLQRDGWRVNSIASEQVKTADL